MNKILILSLFILIFNIPFGYWRANVKTFSLQWFLSVHIPVPVIIALRIFSDIGFGWYTYLFLVSAFFLGHKLGGLIHKLIEKNKIVSSCLVMDLRKLLCEN